MGFNTIYTLKYAMIDAISAVIITKNAEDTLPATLESLRKFSEVVIFDNGSEDSTIEIAASFANVVIHQGSFDGFGPTKNKAVALASNDWVLSLDADESISDSLYESLVNWPATTPPNHYGLIVRENHFMGRAVKRGGWGNDKLVRLFNRRCLLFNSNRVHEFVDTKAAKISTPKEYLLGGTIIHNAVQNIGQFLEKINRYSELRSQDFLDKNKILSPSIILLKSLFAFIRSYILKLGILEGWRGLVIAYSNAIGVFFKYMKAYSIKNK